MDDRTAARATQCGKGGPRHQERPFEVGGDNVIPVVFGNGFDRRHTQGTGVIDQNIELAEFSFDLQNSFLRISGPGHIDADADGITFQATDFRGSFQELLFPSSENSDLGTFSRQCQSDGSSNSGTASSYNCDLSC